jgi:hypothetical protein
MGQERRRGRRISDLEPSSARRCRRVLTSSLVALEWGAIRIRVREIMAPSPGRRFPYRDGVQPALQRVHLSKGRGLPQPARAEPVPGRRPLDAARCPVRAGMRVFRRLRRISPTFVLRSRPSTRCTSLQHCSGGETVPCVRQVGAMKTVFAQGSLKKLYTENMPQGRG